VGGHLLDLLLEDAGYAAVTALVRHELPRSHRKLSQRLVDFDRLADGGPLPRADDVFCCLGTTMKRAGSAEAFRKVDVTYVERLARLAWQHRAKQFLLVSAVGANPRARVFYNRVKGDVEEAVRKVAFDGVHIFRPSLLLGHRQERRPAEWLAMVAGHLLGVALVGPLARYRPIRARTVAKAMIRAATHAAKGVHVYESAGIRALAR
jgi:uncharacterized protein YbjT (DUF2867 family)